MNKNFATRPLAFGLAVALVAGSFMLAPAKVSAAISTMSVTGTGITANSSLVSTAVTPTVNFTTASALNVDGQTIQVTLRGFTVSGAGLSVSDLTLTGCGANTLEAAPGSNNSGGHEVTITNGSTGNNDPVILITLDTTTGTLSCPAGAYTLAIAASEVESRTTAANYVIGITTSLESGSFFYYVGDENDVQISATVDPTLSFVIRNSTDTTDQGNVNGGTVGPNLCDLGNLSTAGVQTCEYRLKVSSNSAGGYSVNIATDGDLEYGANNINNVTEGNTVTNGVEGYGIAFAGGNSDTNGSTAGGGSTACTEAGDFNDDDTPIGATTNTTLYSCSTANNPDATDTSATALVTHRAEADSGTATGTYTQLVTYTVTASF